MKNLILKISIVLLPFFSLNIYGQEIPVKENFSIEEFVEQLAESSDEELDYTSIYDDLNFFLESPLNLNSSSYEDFEKLKILTEFQIKSILNYRQRYGQFRTIYELQMVDGFNYELISMVLPFISLSSEPQRKDLKLTNALKYGNNQIFFRTTRVLESQEGYERDSNGYLGDPTKVYLKYKYQYSNRLLWGITMEKDPGEEFFKGSQKNGFDFYSAHFLYKGKGFFKNIAVGDYIMRFGQGLVMWSGMGTGKSSYVLNTRKRGQGIHKYSSTDENRFQRGFATTMNYKNIDFTLFLSSMQKDANVIYFDTLGTSFEIITSLPNSGYHRLESELEDKDLINEFLSGGNITYSHNKFKLGATYVNQVYDKQFDENFSLNSKYDFHGDHNSNLSLDYQFSLNDIHFFGEAALSQNNAYAIINGATVSLAPQMQLSIIYRDFQKDYFSYFGNAFSEGSRVQNERGIYIGTEIYPIKNWKISAYYDNYKFPWLRYDVDAPSYGNDYLVQIDFTPSRRFTMYWRYKDEAKQISTKQEDFNIEKLDLSIRRNIRYHLNFIASDNVTLKSRIELSFYEENSEAESGYMIYQDVQYRTSKIPLVFNFRFGVFDTESYDTRIYAYESDVLYAFSIPAYYSKGFRTYLTMKYSVNDKLDVWLRYSQTNYADKNEIGSGLSLIEGNTKSEIKFQLRYKF